MAYKIQRTTMEIFEIYDGAGDLVYVDGDSFFHSHDEAMAALEELTAPKNRIVCTNCDD
jgi:hypothetical protein